MSDGMDFNEGEQADVALPKAKKGGINILKILMFVGIGIVVVALVVAISFFTVSLVIGSSGVQKTSVPVSEDYEEIPPVYAYTESIGKMTLRTIDNGSLSFNIKIGFDKEDKVSIDELASRKIQMQDFLRSFFSKKTTEELIKNETGIKQEIRDKMNGLMQNKGIKDIAFTEFNVIPE